MISDLFRSDWANALGWTLMHSMWQSTLILLLVLGCLRFIPGAYSKVRYAISCAGLLLIVVSSFITFSYMLDRPDAPTVSDVGTHQSTLLQRHQDSEFTIDRYFSDAAAIIQQNMPLIMTIWLIGLVIFSLRLVSGVAYTVRLTSSALRVDNEWSEYIRELAKKLGIQKVISLSQSRVINSPMVIGYFKPVILLPIGMLSGLTTEQLETIFLHELAHIKRHDYLVNFIQSVVEAVFFFNPVVWILSGLVRREREFCCDDLVIGQHGHAAAYAKALVQLEVIRLTKHSFALSLADDKNQLLNRIRRIMEKSAKTYSGKSRLILPAVMLAAGLACVSWLSIHQENSLQNDTATVAQDTVKPKHKKGSASYSRKKIITTDKNGHPHEEVVEDFEGDESLRPLLEKGFGDFSQSFPGGFSLDSLMPDMDISGLADSVPGLNFKEQEQWDALSKTFGNNFGKEFEKFYSLRGIDPSTFMKEFEGNFAWPEPPDNFDLPADSLHGMEPFDQGAFQNLQEQMDHFRDFQLDQLPHGNSSLDDRSDNFDRYEKALRHQLIEDGYLSRDEAITSMEWSDDVFKVNGKDIKPADRKRYQDLHDQYIGTGKYSGKMQ